jgi:hypothetical protein
MATSVGRRWRRNDHLEDAAHQRLAPNDTHELREGQSGDDEIKTAMMMLATARQ